MPMISAEHAPGWVGAQ